MLVASGQVNATDGADVSHRLGELEFATEKLFGLYPHARRLEGHHLDGARVGPRVDWQLGRRTTLTGNGAASRLSHSSIVLWNRALSRGGML